ncbi:hypothetical protein FB389_0676 [Rarobacter incanus]|uniref:Uncharacterized protein n=1 Tax=Rarobacter incanus TaxID=153494 RepID=A0A542SN41_9MICO|nr:hypothetical protein FB389_0676 [Rarobacter incanus]
MDASSTAGAAPQRPGPTTRRARRELALTGQLPIVPQAAPEITVEPPATTGAIRAVDETGNLTPVLPVSQPPSQALPIAGRTGTSHAIAEQWAQLAADSGLPTRGAEPKAAAGAPFGEPAGGRMPSGVQAPAPKQVGADEVSAAGAPFGEPAGGRMPSGVQAPAPKQVGADEVSAAGAQRAQPPAAQSPAKSAKQWSPDGRSAQGSVPQQHRAQQPAARPLGLPVASGQESDSAGPPTPRQQPGLPAEPAVRQQPGLPTESAAQAAGHATEATVPAPKQARPSAAPAIPAEPILEEIPQRSMLDTLATGSIPVIRVSPPTGSVPVVAPARVEATERPDGDHDDLDDEDHKHLNWLHWAIIVACALILALVIWKGDFDSIAMASSANVVSAARLSLLAPGTDLALTA